MPGQPTATVRTKTRCWVSVGVNARKSCSPSSRAPRSFGSAGDVERARPPPASPHLERRALRAAMDPVAVAPRHAPSAARGSPRRLLRDATTATSSGRAVFSASAARSAGGPPSTSTLTTWPSAWTPVSVRPATARLSTGRTAPRRLAHDALDRPQARLRGPAAEAGAVVLERQLQAHAAGAVLCRRALFFDTYRPCHTLALAHAPAFVALSPATTAGGFAAPSRSRRRSRTAARSARASSLDSHKTYEVTLVTNCGTFTIRLDVKDSPHTAASFYTLATTASSRARSSTGSSPAS